MKSSRAIDLRRIDIDLLLEQSSGRCLVALLHRFVKACIHWRGGYCRHRRKRNQKDCKESASHNSLIFPVLSPRLSIGTPALSNSVSRRFVMGVWSGYFKCRPPFKRPAPPPITRVGRGK